jgi:hypothetical protein
MSTIKVNSIEPANAGSEDYFLARAWVNFNGTGTAAIRDSGNVSTLTDNGTGSYTVSFSNAMGNANYAAPYSMSALTTDATSGSGAVINRSTASFQVDTENSGGTNTDMPVNDTAIFGDLA